MALKSRENFSQEAGVKPLSPNEIGRELAKLQQQFIKTFVELDSDWHGNFDNAHKELLKVLSDVDSDIFGNLAAAAYASPPENKHEMSFLYSIRSNQKDGLTEYGRMIVAVRFCLGYLGNLKHGSGLLNAECKALVFGYEAYWRHGGDFLFGSTIDSALKRLGDPGGWGQADAAAQGREEKDLIAHGMRVARALWELHSWHRLSQVPNMEMAPIDKPAFIDFRSN